MNAVKEMNKRIILKLLITQCLSWITKPDFKKNPFLFKKGINNKERNINIHNSMQFHHPH